ncbi:MAG: hypothetical protein ACI4U3_06940 [Traorella sp.]
MKKLLSICCLALLVLCGCKDASTSLTDGNEALITVGKTKITKNDVYDGLKSENGVTAILSKLTAYIVDKEVPVTDELIKEADEYIESFKEYIGEDDFNEFIESMGYDTVEQYRDENVLLSVRSNKIAESYVTNNYEDANEKYQLRKVQILQVTDSKTAAEIQSAIKNNELTFEEALTQYADSLKTTTYTGKEQIITNLASLDSSIIENIMAVETDNTLLDSYQFNSDLTSFYIVKVVKVNIDQEEGKEVLLKLSSISDDAFAFYLKQYGFRVYDIDIYNGIKSQAPTYLVQDSK